MAYKAKDIVMKISHDGDGNRIGISADGCVFDPAGSKLDVGGKCVSTPVISASDSVGTIMEAAEAALLKAAGV